MNQNETQNNTTADDQQQVEQNSSLDDLRLTAEEVDGIKGGCGPFHKDDPPPPPTGGGMFINNHNETVVSDEDKDSMSLTDLEPIDEVKGGGTGIFGGHNTGALRNVSNNNTHTGTTVNGNLQIAQCYFGASVP